MRMHDFICIFCYSRSCISPPHQQDRTVCVSMTAIMQNRQNLLCSSSCPHLYQPATCSGWVECTHARCESRAPSLSTQHADWAVKIFAQRLLCTSKQRLCTRRRSATLRCLHRTALRFIVRNPSPKVAQKHEHRRPLECIHGNSALSADGCALRSDTERVCALLTRSLRCALEDHDGIEGGQPSDERVVAVRGQSILVLPQSGPFDYPLGRQERRVLTPT